METIFVLTDTKTQICSVFYSAESMWLHCRMAGIKNVPNNGYEIRKYQSCEMTTEEKELIFSKNPK